MNGSRLGITRGLTALLLGFSLVGLNACATPNATTSTSSLAAQTPSVTATEDNTPSPVVTPPTIATPTPEAALGSGPIDKTNHIDLTDYKGYKSSLTIDWHQTRNLTPADFAIYHFCFTGPTPDLNTIFRQNTLVKGAVVDVSATFPQVNGFNMPDNSGPLIAASGAWLCGAVPGTNGANSDPGALFLTPASNHATFLIYAIAEKTPNSPDGDFGSGPGGVVSIGMTYIKSCVIQEVPNTNLCESHHN